MKRIFESFKESLVNEQLNEKEKPWNEKISSEIGFAKRLDNKEDGIPHQREIMRDSFNRDFEKKDESKMTDKEVISFLNNFVKRIREEKKYTKQTVIIEKKLKSLIQAGKFYVNVMGDRVREEDKLRFTIPLLSDDQRRSRSEILDFVQNATEIEVTITNRYAKNWDVFYSGKIDNGEEKIEFNDVNNGFAVNLG